MYVSGKYSSRIGRYLAIAYLIVAGFILSRWIFPGDYGNTINGLYCGSGNLFSDYLCISINPLHNPKPGLIETLLFSLPIIPSAYLIHIIDPYGQRVYPNFLSYVLWNILIWLTIMALNAYTFYLIGLGITKIKKKYFDKK